MAKQTNFYVWLRSGLRKLSRRWPAVYEAMAAAKVPYTGENKRRKFSYICNKCKGEFDAKSVACDHITPAGQLNNKEDIADFVEKLFCDVQGLQVLCDGCHSVKTYMERYNVTEKEAKLNIAVAAIMKDKKKALDMLQRFGYSCKNDEQRKKALREILSKQQEE